MVTEEVLASPLSKGVAAAVNQIYLWNGNSSFYKLATPSLINFYQHKVRLWDEWISGSVTGFHNADIGILPSGIARSIVDRIADIINGDGVIFKNADIKGKSSKALDFVSNTFAYNTSLKRKLKDAVLKAVSLGNSLIKTNYDAKGQLWYDILSANRFFVDIDSKGEIVKSRTFVNIYIAGVSAKDKSADSYALVEERYYKDICDKSGKVVDRKPVVKYCIYMMPAVGNTFMAGYGNSIPYDNLPKSVKNEFRQNYKSVFLDEEMYLPFTHLGVYHAKFTEYVTTMPNIKMGESVLDKILNLMVKYDTVFSEDYNDLYISRAKLAVPKLLGNDNQYRSTFIFAQTGQPSTDKDNKPVPFMPVLRTEQLIKEREEICKNIASHIGVASSSLFSDISDTRGNVTAREISSEETATINYRDNKRSLFLPIFNKVVNDALKFYGYQEEIIVDFADAGTTNKSFVVEVVTQMVNAKLMSRYEAMKTYHPNWDEDQIQEELRKIKQDEQERASSQQSELFGNLKYDDKDGEFVNEEADTNGEETEPELASADN